MCSFLCIVVSRMTSAIGGIDIGCFACDDAGWLA
jgi:hypothetical protein